MKVVRSKWAALDQPSVAGPYKMATAPSLPALKSARGKAAGPLTRAYRQAVGWIEKIFRWLNQSAYLVSVPFLMCMILGLAVGSHSLMVLGATAVVLLNLGRIVADQSRGAHDPGPPEIDVRASVVVTTELIASEIRRGNVGRLTCLRGDLRRLLMKLLGPAGLDLELGG